MFNNKLPQFVSPVLDPLTWGVHAPSLPWEDLDPYAFPVVAILGKVVKKMQDYLFRIFILVVPDPIVPDSSCLASRASAIKEQGFSEALATQIEEVLR